MLLQPGQAERHGERTVEFDRCVCDVGTLVSDRIAILSAEAGCAALYGLVRGCDCTVVLGEDFRSQVDHALVCAPRRLLGAQRGRAGLAEGVAARCHQLAHGAQHTARVARGHHQRLADLRVFEVVTQPLLLVVLLILLGSRRVEAQEVGRVGREALEDASQVACPRYVPVKHPQVIEDDALATLPAPGLGVNSAALQRGDKVCPEAYLRVQVALRPRP
eukprot:scaffold97652_cov66-Phaeocystis_antarctica.AAC.2